MAMKLLRLSTPVKIGLVIAIIITGYFILKKDPHPPAYKSRIVISGSVKSVQDSMLVLRHFCEGLEPMFFFSCHIMPIDSALFFDGNILGKITSLSPSDKAFTRLREKNARRVLAVLKFLHRNRISGVYHDVSRGNYWLYPYGEDMNYLGNGYIRSLYIWNSPNDTLTPQFKRNFTIIDRRENMVLVSHIYD